MAWTNSPTATPSGLAADFVEISLRDSFREPRRLRVLGTPVDLSALKQDNYVVAGQKDHLAVEGLLLGNRAARGDESIRVDFGGTRSHHDQSHRFTEGPVLRRTGRWVRSRRMARRRAGAEGVVVGRLRGLASRPFRRGALRADIPRFRAIPGPRGGAGPVRQRVVGDPQGLADSASQSSHLCWAGSRHCSWQSRKTFDAAAPGQSRSSNSGGSAGSRKGNLRQA